MDTILPSASNYKINIQINNLTLDDCSFVSSSDIIRPYFEEAVSRDQDVTGLMVYLKNSNGVIVGKKVLYTVDRQEPGQKDNEKDNKIEVINDKEKESDKDKDKETLKEKENDKENENDTVKSKDNEKENEKEQVTDDIVIQVKNLDDYMPYFPLPEDLQPGMYTIVSQVMSGKNILQRIEKSFYYINSIDFSYEGINSYLPGVTESAQLIPKGTTVLLEASLGFVDSIDPYIIWYEGKNKISEGSFSEGAGQLFWKAPEQSGFFYIRAEVFPVRTNARLTGYKKDISLLVSSIAFDVHLVSENIQQLIHWYTFEGNLNDSKMAGSSERVLRTANNNAPKWMGVDETYGLVTGYNNIINLPAVKIPGDNINNNTWQTLFRFNSVNDGEIFSVLFGAAGRTRLQLFKDGHDIIMTLSSPVKSVSQIYSLTSPVSEVPEDGSPLIVSEGPEKTASFLVAGISFSVLPESITAHINILNDFSESELASDPAVIEIKIEDEFRILLGSQGNNFNMDDRTARSAVIWDEFALYYMPPANFYTAGTVVQETGEEP